MLPHCKHQRACVAFVTVIFPGKLTEIPLENYCTFYAVVCRHQWLTVFYELHGSLSVGRH